MRVITQPSSPAPPAFTLVETVLALGVVTIGLLSAVSLLPSGLGALRQAADQTAGANICDQVAAAALACPFENLDERFAGRTFCFDDSGAALPDDADAHAARWLALTTVAEPVYPSNGAETAAAVRRVRVELTDSAAPPDARKQLWFFEIAASGTGVTP